MMYDIWQLPLSNHNCFNGYSFINEIPKLRDYVHVYHGNIDMYDKDDDYIMENIFEILNANHPADYFARSLSVSDVICLNIDDKTDRRWYYVDSFGFTKLNEEEFMEA